MGKKEKFSQELNDQILTGPDPAERSWRAIDSRGFLAHDHVR